MKSKKWTNRLFQHMLDMAVINSWILYKKVSLKMETNPKNILKLADFWTELAETLCKYGTVFENKRGRSSLNRYENPPKKEQNLVHRHYRHMTFAPMELDTTRATALKEISANMQIVKKITFVLCTKCKISLCDNRKNNFFKFFMLHKRKYHK
ncbi:unnamed protein product [Parnassius apollo]|uniref:(apollo) hypothetical protein n=1 Tax=Parnassius apollo TaxID=110799 RepID=A0A8S3XUC0_PARAO|nr:unnamed protein product [Parnassius apollo]